MSQLWIFGKVLTWGYSNTLNIEFFIEQILFFELLYCYEKIMYYEIHQIFLKFCIQKEANKNMLNLFNLTLSKIKKYFHIERKYFNYYILYFLLIIGIILLKNGFWPIPNLKMIFQISQSLLKVPFENPLAHYLFWNYFQNLVFKIFGGSSYKIYILYTFSTSLLFIFILVFWFIRYHGENVVKENKVLLLSVFPVAMIPFYWFGVDGMTLLLMLLLMILLDRLSLVIFFSLFLSWQHFEQGFVAFGFLFGSILLKYLFTKEQNLLVDIKRILIILIILIFGKLLLMGFFKIADVGIQGDRYTWLKHHLHLMVNQYKVSWYYILWSLFGVAWFIVFKYKQKLWALFITTIFVLLFLSIMGDQTRVGVIILFPTMFYWLLQDKEIWIHINSNWVLFLLIAYLLLPPVVVWGGYPFGSLLPYNKKIINDFIVNGKITDFDYLLPFTPEKSPQIDIIKNLGEYKVKIEIQDPNKYMEVDRDKEREILVIVKNVSSSRYPSKGTQSGKYAVFASYHVLKKNGEIILWDGLRTPFPHDIASGVSIPIKLKILPNFTPGEYKLQIDLVHEGVTWFGDKDKNNILEVPLVVK